MLAEEVVRSLAARVSAGWPLSEDAALNSASGEGAAVVAVSTGRPAVSRSVAPLAAPSPRKVAGRGGARAVCVLLLPRSSFPTPFSRPVSLLVLLEGATSAKRDFSVSVAAGVSESGATAVADESLGSEDESTAAGVLASETPVVFKPPEVPA